MQSQHNILNFEVIRVCTQSCSACRMHTAVSLGNKLYWCCCRITFEIASLFSLFFYFPSPMWKGSGGHSKSETSEMFSWWKSRFFLLFSPPLLFVHSFCLQYCFWSQRGPPKRQVFPSRCLKSNSDMTVLLGIMHRFVQLFVKAHAKTLIGQFT